MVITSQRFTFETRAPFQRRGCVVTSACKLGARAIAAVCFATVAAALAPVLQPDVVLLDLNLPDSFGLKLIPPLRSKWPRSKIIILTFSDSARLRLMALAAGAAAFITKAQAPSELIPQILKMALAS